MFHSKDTKSLEEALAQGEGRIQELEAALGEARAALAEKERALAARDAEMTCLKEQGEQTLGRYRALLLAGAPEVPAELVAGATVAEVEASLERARALARKVQEQLAQSGRIPAGAPVRGAPDLSALSPKEKIAWGLGRRG